MAYEHWPECPEVNDSPVVNRRDLDEISRYDGVPIPPYRALSQHIELGTIQQPTIATSWGQWLACYPWEAWGTLTFKFSEPTEHQLTRAFGRFLRWLRRAGASDASYFFGTEIGAGGRSHLHVLLCGLSPHVTRAAAWAWWWKRYGRGEIRGYDPTLGAAHYVAKYVSKACGNYDIDLRGFHRWDCETGEMLDYFSPSWKRTRAVTG